MPLALELSNPAKSDCRYAEVIKKTYGKDALRKTAKEERSGVWVYMNPIIHANVQKQQNKPFFRQGWDHAAPISIFFPLTLLHSILNDPTIVNAAITAAVKKASTNASL